MSINVPRVQSLLSGPVEHDVSRNKSPSLYSEVGKGNGEIRELSRMAYVSRSGWCVNQGIRLLRRVRLLFSSKWLVVIGN